MYSVADLGVLVPDQAALEVVVAASVLVDEAVDLLHGFRRLL